MAKINYRNSNVSHQDHALVKAFKIELMKFNLRSFQSEGFVPIWSRQKDVKMPLEMEFKALECYALPVAGPASLRSMLKGVKRGCGMVNFNYVDKDGNEISKTIFELSERSLVDALRTMSQIVFETEGFNRVIRLDENNTKYLLLNAEQLKPGGRLNRIPFGKLFNRFLIRIYMFGEANAADKKRLMNEWHVTRKEIDNFSREAMALHALRENKDPKLKTARTEFRQNIEQFMAEIRSGGRRTEYLPVVLPVVTKIIEIPHKELRDHITTDIKRMTTITANILKDFYNSGGRFESHVNTLSEKSEVLKQRYNITFKYITDRYPDLQPQAIQDIIDAIIKSNTHSDLSNDLDKMIAQVVDENIESWAERGTRSHY